MFDYEQLLASLVDAGYGEESDIAKAIKNLAYTLDASELPESARSIVLQLFSQRGLDQLRENTGKLPESYRWSEFEIGNTRVGDTVRVRLDAYSTVSGSSHNGLVGVIESVYAGRVEVRYVGRYADIPQTHPREKLEILKKV
jgi:hypothetical protein